MANISLEASVRTCKVDQGWANKIESDRFFNPNLMMCPVWSGRDLTGRKVCPDSFYTKRAGCNSPEDRILVENALRPKYSEYITLDTSGISGRFEGVGPMEGMDVYDITRSGQSPGEDLYNITRNTPSFGNQFGSNIFPGCGTYNYSNAAAANSQASRGMQFSKEGYKANCNKCRSGF
jgi:hypothetical protein